MLNSSWRLGLAVGVAALLGTGEAWAQEHEEHQDVREHRERNVRINVSRSGHGSLGVRLRDVDAEAAERLAIGDPRGTLVVQVNEGSAAEKAGLRKDDVIVAFRGEPVHSVAQLVRLVRETPVGREIAIQVIRDGASTSLNATLEEGDRWGLRWFGEPGAQFRYSFRSGGEDGDEGAHIIKLPEIPDIELPDFTAHGWFPGLGRGRKLGIDYQQVEGQLAEYFGVEQGEGLLITGVVEDGPRLRGRSQGRRYPPGDRREEGPRPPRPVPSRCRSRVRRGDRGQGAARPPGREPHPDRRWRAAQAPQQGAVDLRVARVPRGGAATNNGSHGGTEDTENRQDTSSSRRRSAAPQD